MWNNLKSWPRGAGSPLVVVARHPLSSPIIWLGIELLGKQIERYLFTARTWSDKELEAMLE